MASVLDKVEKSAVNSESVDAASTSKETVIQKAEGEEDSQIISVIDNTERNDVMDDCRSASAELNGVQIRKRKKRRMCRRSMRYQHRKVCSSRAISLRQDDTSDMTERCVSGNLTGCEQDSEITGDAGVFGSFLADVESACVKVRCVFPSYNE